MQETDAAVPASPAPPPVTAMLDEARQAMTAGRTHEALALAEAACEAGGGWPAEMLRIMLLFRTGSLNAVLERGRIMLPASAEASPGDRFDLLRVVALSAIEGGRFDLALPSAQEALVLAEDAQDKPRVALALNALACCFERMGDPWQAERMMVDALAIARKAGQLHPLLATLNNLVAAQIGMFHLMRDASTPEQAHAPLERALPHAREAIQTGANGEPFMRCFLIGNLGEVLLHLGKLQEAEEALNVSLDLARSTGAQAQIMRLGYTLAELDLRCGRPEQAWERLQGVLAAGPLALSDVRMTELRVHHGMWRCARALGRTETSLHHLEQYLRLERERGLTQLRAQSELFVTRAEADRARRDSHRDQLTQLGNRREADVRWPQLLEQARRQGSPLAVVLVDLDHFKRINDRFGHGVGDAVLVALSTLLRENTRQADLVARIGGEEFLLVMPDTSTARARDVCERLRQRVAEQDWSGLAPGLTVSLSAGITAAPPFDAAELTARADEALYRAKAEGRDRVIVQL